MVSFDRTENRPLRSAPACCSALGTNANRSVRLHLGGVDDVAPLLRVRLDEGGKLLGRADDRLKHVGGKEFLAKFRVLEHPPHVGVDLGDDIVRRIARRKQPEPRHGLEVRETGLGNGRYIGNLSKSFTASDSEQLHPSFFLWRNG